MTTPVPDVISAQGLSGCVVDDCGKPIVGRGRCRRHYGQWHRATAAGSREPALRLKRLTPEQRFTRMVDRRGPDECWPWKGATTSGGHGEFYVSPERGKIPAHVFALELATGQRCPAGLEGCHPCDNPPCCNPAHSYYGTRKQNVADMWNRGRANHPARLTEVGVVAMREAFAAGTQQKQLAERFGVSASHVSEIVNGHLWKHAGGPIPPRGRNGHIN